MLGFAQGSAHVRRLTGVDVARIDVATRPGSGRRPVDAWVRPWSSHGGSHAGSHAGRWPIPGHWSIGLADREVRDAVARNRTAGAAGRPPARRTRIGARVAGLATAAWLAAATTAVPAQPVTGLVRDGVTGIPIEGARVHVRANPDAPVVVTGADGRFTLPAIGFPAGTFQVSAARAYDPAAPANWETAAVPATAGGDVTISLRPVPAAQNPGYQPRDATGCAGCHVEQFQQWLTSNHSMSARNVLVRDLYSGDGTGPATGPAGQGYVYIQSHPAPASGFCATCHAPNERPSDPGAVRYHEVSSVPGLDGVTCTSCHQLHDVNGNVRAIHLLGNAEFRFPQATAGGASVTHQYVWGPLDDVSFGSMRAVYAPLFRTSRLCASCHEYENPATGIEGQTTYSEWLASPAAAAGTHCQTCHMPAADAPGRIAEVAQAPIRPGSQRHDHGFPGVYSGRLGNPVALALAAVPSAGRVDARTDVVNLVQGHAWPTGIDIRNALVVVEAFLDGVPLAPVGGDTIPFWASDDVLGVQDGDFAGMAGRGYAKVLEGRINGAGPVVRPVPFIDAEAVHANTVIPAGATDIGRYAFALPAGVVAGNVLSVRARVIYRRAWRSLAVTKDWVTNPDGEPWERLVATRTVSYPLDAAMLDRLLVDGFE